MSLRHKYSEDWKLLDPDEIVDVVLMEPNGLSCKAKIHRGQATKSDLVSLADRGEKRQSATMTIWPAESLTFGIVTDVVVNLVNSEERWLVQRATAVRIGQAITHYTATAVMLDESSQNSR